jgi:thiopurine S-methyltransferase
MSETRAFWQQRWEQHQIGFNEGKPNDLLVAHAGRLEIAPSMRILVPLAGKAADLRWLSARGHDVVGVEFIIHGIDEFFREQDVDTWSHHHKLGTHDAFTANHVTMICEDFFAIRAESVGTFDAIYDRAALIAVEPAMRARYVETCRGLLKENAPTLLISVAYDQSKTHGPPWSVDDATVRELFAGRSIEALQKRTGTPPPRLAQAGVGALEETAFLIR